MKFYLLLLFSIISFVFYSQITPPKLINYQGVARDAAGVPLIGENISVKFEIYDNNPGGSLEFTETQPINTGTLGLFTTKIGISSNLASVTWSVGNHYLQITMSGSFGTATLPRMQLVTVPYAFYADKAGSAPSPTVGVVGNVLYVGSNSTPLPSGATYTSGAGISITSNSIINVAPNQTVNITQGGVAQVTGAYPNYNISVPQQTLTLTSANSFSSNLGGAVTFTAIGASSPWTQLPPNVYLTTGTNNVGIGISAPGARLDVNGAAGIIINATTTGNGNVVNAVTTGTGIGVYSNSSLGTAVLGTNTSNSGAAIVANNFGNAESFYGYKIGAQTGTVAKFQNLNLSNPNSVLNIYNNANTNTAQGIIIGTKQGSAIDARDSSNTNAAIKAVNDNGGDVFYGTKNNSTGTVARFENQFLTNNSPIVVVTNSSISSAIGIQSNNFGGGIAINAIATSGNAISANNTSTAAVTINASNTGGGGVINALANSSGDAVNITNSGSGNALSVIGNSPAQTLLVNNSGVNGGAIYAGKSGSTQGYAGYFENLYQANSIETLRAVNQSTVNGAIALSVTSSTAGIGQVALQINNGHLKSIAAAPPSVSVITNSLGGFLPVANITVQSTDIKGTVTVSIPSFTGALSSGYVDVNVVFNKPYSIGTTVMLTPVEPSKFSYVVISQNNTNFTVRIINNNTLSASFVTGFNYLRFNYFVIE